MIITNVSGKMVFELFEMTVEELEAKKVELLLALAKEAKRGSVFFDPDPTFEKTSAIDRVISIKLNLAVTN